MQAECPKAPPQTHQTKALYRQLGNSYWAAKDRRPEVQQEIEDLCAFERMSAAWVKHQGTEQAPRGILSNGTPLV